MIGQKAFGPENSPARTFDINSGYTVRDGESGVGSWESSVGECGIIDLDSMPAHATGNDMTPRNRVFLPFLPIATEVFS